MSSSLFPLGCSCSSYGHGLTMTRVNSRTCSVHGEGKAWLCRCGRTEHFPVGCPCQKQEQKS